MRTQASGREGQWCAARLVHLSKRDALLGLPASGRILQDGYPGHQCDLSLRSECDVGYATPHFRISREDLGRRAEGEPRVERQYLRRYAPASRLLERQCDATER